MATLNDVGEHLSTTELVAEKATQEARTIFILHWLRHKLGQVMNGVVIRLTNDGVTVRLCDISVEGMIRPEALGPDQWKYDDASQCLIGQHSGTLIRLAQPMRVRIVEVQPAAGQLDLIPASNLMRKPSHHTNGKKKQTSSSTSQKRRRKTKQKSKPGQGWFSEALKNSHSDNQSPQKP